MHILLEEFIDVVSFHVGDLVGPVWCSTGLIRGMQPQPGNQHDGCHPTVGEKYNRCWKRCSLKKPSSLPREHGHLPSYWSRRKMALPGFVWGCFHYPQDSTDNNPVSAFPTYSQPFILDVDASGDGLGAVLSMVRNGSLTRTEC